MPIKKYLFLAVKNLRRRGLRSWLTMLGIFIGIAAVVSLISLGDGLQSAIVGQFSSLGTDKLIITNAETGFGPPGSTAISKLNDHDVKVVEQVNGVERAIPRLLRAVTFDFNKIQIYTFAVSMPEDEKKIGLIYETINLEAESGKLLGANDHGKVLLGHDFAKESNFNKVIYPGNKVTIQGKEFVVAGILKASSTFQLNSVALIHDQEMKDLLNIVDEWDMIVVKVANGFNTEEVANQIEDRIRRDRGEKIGEEDFSVQTPTQALSSVKTILNIINLIIVGIAAVSLIVGGVGIANTMYTSVLERTREIGVMKAIGARNSDILLIFLFESALLGLVGGVVGAAMGLGLAFGLSGAANSALGTKLLAVSVSWTLVLGSIAFSLIVGVISGVLPAIQASKLKPVDALRS